MSASILAPIPTTPLYDRLAAEKRLDPADPECAFVPKQMTRGQLKQGYRDLVGRLYDPEPFFSRILDAYRNSPSFQERRAEIDARRSKGPAWRRYLAATIVFARLVDTLRRERCLTQLARAYWQAWRKNRELGPRAIPYTGFVELCTQHWHLFKLAQGPQRSLFLEAAADSAGSDGNPGPNADVGIHAA